MQEFVRHIWGVELRWSQRLAGLPVTAREDVPHGRWMRCSICTARRLNLSRIACRADESWEQTFVLDMDWLPPEARAVSRRKVAVHALFHSQRHWAQLATLVRAAGFPSGFKGDLFFSRALGSWPSCGT